MENRIIDFSQVEDGMSFINKAGRYTLEVEKFETGKSAKKGTEFHRFFCKSEDGESIRFELYIVPAAMWRYKSFLKALGASTDNAYNIDELPNKLIGKKFVGVVVEESYETYDALTGEVSEVKTAYKVDRFEPLGS